MRYLDQRGLETARQFMKHRARPLEQAIYEYEFESGSVEKVLKELSATDWSPICVARNRLLWQRLVLSK